MAAPSAPRVMPKHLKATYLANQEYLLEETRATRWHYFPGPVLWLLIFGVLTYVGWGAPRHWYGSYHYGLWVGGLASDLHIAKSSVESALALLFLILFLVGLLWLLVRYLRWVRTVYAVTSRRVIIQKGILGRSFDEIPVTQVRGVDVRQTFFQRVLRYGTLRVSSEGGTRVGNEDWPGIPAPFVFQKHIENAADAITTPGGAASPAAVVRL